MTKESKPIISTMINTTALALTSYGMVQITNHALLEGYAGIGAGFLLEFFKYWGMKAKLW